MADVALSRSFRLSEFPGWQRASPAEVATLQRTVSSILEPTRARWGRIVPTSWMWWRSGQPRTGAHADPGSVDFVTLDAPLLEVWEWMRLNLLPLGVIGELGYERDHIHVTRWGVGGYGEAWTEPREGTYDLVEASPWDGLLLAAAGGVAVVALLKD